MASASSSSSASSASAINATGGGITINRPNYVAWVVGGLALVIVAILFLRRKR